MKPTKEQIYDLIEACSGKISPGKRQNFVRMVQPRFAPLVKSGQKRNTIRPLPKRIPRCGDTLSIRQWRGKPYRSKQRVILETTVREIKTICIAPHGVFMQPPDGCLLAISGVKIMCLEGPDADRFARDDGFTDWQEMKSWFDAEHGLPFDGIIIYWNYPP